MLVPQKDVERVIRNLSQLHDVAYWKNHLSGSEETRQYLVLPRKLIKIQSNLDRFMFTEDFNYFTGIK